MSDDIDIPMPAMAPSYRVPRRREGMDLNTKRLAIIAGGIGGALAVLVGAWSLSGHHSGGVPVVEADKTPLRVKPTDPGGMQVTGQNESILSGQNSDTRAALAPPAETPAPQALKEATAQAPKRAEPAPAPSLSPTPVTAAITAPAPAMAPADAKQTVSKIVPAKTVATAAAAQVHGPQVQLAALTSEEAALAEWTRLSRKMPDLLGGRKPVVAKVEHDGHVFWRLRTSGFTDTADAGSFCERMKAKGAGCAVASF